MGQCVCLLPEAWGSHELHVFNLLPNGAAPLAGQTGLRLLVSRLMELLIVISIIVILMLIAIPTANTIRKHTNEVSAQKSLQTLEQAQSMYVTNYPVTGFACTLQALAGDPGSGRPARPRPSSCRASSPPASKTATSSTSPTA